MPGFYKEDEYDIAGFSVGVVDKDKIINGLPLKKDYQLGSHLVESIAMAIP